MGLTDNDALYKTAVTPEPDRYEIVLFELERINEDTPVFSWQSGGKEH